MRAVLVALSALVMLVSPASAQVIELNTATVSELDKLPGLGKTKAKAVVEYREKNGAFKSVDELDRVKGIGKATVEKLRAHLSVNGKVDAAAIAAAMIDLNTATVKELDKLPGIGKGKARAIIEYREANGGFKSVAELAKVKGISKKTVKKLEGSVVVKAAAK